MCKIYVLLICFIVYYPKYIPRFILKSKSLWKGFRALKNCGLCALIGDATLFISRFSQLFASLKRDKVSTVITGPKSSASSDPRRQKKAKTLQEKVKWLDLLRTAHLYWSTSVAWINDYVLFCIVYTVTVL